MKLKASLDDGVTWVDVSKVRIIAHDPDGEEEGWANQVHVTVNGSANADDEGVGLELFHKGDRVASEFRSFNKINADLE
jgi:hypothetical protein